MSYGTVTPELKEWMEAHRDPKWKYKPPALPKPSKLSAPRRSAEFADEVSRWQYRRGFDYRMIREPVSLEEFLARKHNPKWREPAIKRGRAHTATHYPVDQERAARQWIIDYVRRHSEAQVKAA